MAVTTHEAADFGGQRVVTLRVFNGHIHRLGFLALAEAAVVVVALHAAIAIRFAGFDDPFEAFEDGQGALWPRALLVAAVFVLAQASLGRYPNFERGETRV